MLTSPSTAPALEFTPSGGGDRAWPLHPSTRRYARATVTIAVAVLALAGVFAVALGPLPLNPYDVGYALDWGRELIHGQVPDVRVLGASTPHPLSIVAGAWAALSGGQALDRMHDLVVVAAAGVVVALAVIGRAVRLPSIGLVAALALGSSAPFMAATVGKATVSDLCSLAFLLAALALELRRRRRGVAPMALLAVGGMWRPELWLISLAYWIHCAAGLGGSQRARLAAVAVSAPALWATTDLILAGNPLYSLTYTRWATEVAWRPTGIATVPRVLYTTLTAYFGAPLLAGAGAGLVLDLRHRCLPRAIPAVLALSLVSFVAVGAAGLPVINRYALPITVLITLYFGFFLEGWRRVRSLRLRRAWAAAACALVVLTVAGAPAGIGALLNQRTTLNQLGRMTAHLGTLLHGQATRAAISGCGPLQTSYQVVPLLAYDLGRNPRDVVVVNTGIPVRGSVVEPARAQHLFAAPSYAVSAYTQRGFRLVAADAEWVVFTRCPTSVVGG